MPTSNNIVDNKYLKGKTDQKVTESEKRSRYSTLEKILIVFTAGLALIFIELYHLFQNKKKVEPKSIIEIEPKTEIEKALDKVLKNPGDDLSYYRLLVIIGGNDLLKKETKDSSSRIKELAQKYTKNDKQAEVDLLIKLIDDRYVDNSYMYQNMDKLVQGTSDNIVKLRGTLIEILPSSIDTYRKENPDTEWRIVSRVDDFIKELGGTQSQARTQKYINKNRDPNTLT